MPVASQNNLILTERLRSELLIQMIDGAEDYAAVIVHCSFLITESGCVFAIDFDLIIADGIDLLRVN